MLARLQRFTTLCLLAMALAWAWVLLAHGRPGWALAGVLLILFGYAAILALECVLMTLANRRDGLGAARVPEVLSAWWGEVRSAPLVFCWRQPFRSMRHPDRPDAGAPGQRGLLLVHGFLCNRGIWNRWYPRLVRDGIPHVGLSLEPVFGDIDDYAAQIDAGVLRLERATGLPPVIVAHSMGGLAVRAWLRHRPDAADRVHHVVTLGTPHGGTALARFAFSDNTRQMLHGSEWVGGLGGAEPPGLRERFTCVYSRCDNIVFPASSACLPHAARREVPRCAHVHLVDHPIAWDVVVAHLGPVDACRPPPTGIG